MMVRSGRSRSQGLSGFEQLESRQLLAADLVISELLAVNDSGLVDQDGDLSDWIEIHNTSSNAISLQGWHLTDDSMDLTRWQFPGVSLDGGDYQLVRASGKDRSDPAGELHANFKLGGDGEFLALVRPDGSTVEYSFSPEFPRQVSNVSYGISADLSELGYFTVPTPGAPNLQAPIDDPLRTLIINEVMYHPSSERDEEEFVEIFNRGSEPVDVAGWRLSGGVDFNFPELSLEAGAFLIVAADPQSFQNIHGDQINVVGPWMGRLSNRSDTINLRDASDKRIDRVVYADEGDWALRARGPNDRGSQGWVWLDDHDGGGKSLERKSGELSAEFGQNWAASTVAQGTPGGVNSVASTDLAPLIIETEHAPPIPNSTDDVVVTAQIVDEALNPLRVTLNWRVDGQSEFNSTPMLDDGNSGDEVAGDRNYLASIPAQADLTVVEFFVEAADEAGNLRSWPAPTAESGQATNALYQVIDAFDATIPWGPESHPQYFEVMTAMERQEFMEIDRRSDAQMNATFISVDQSGIDVRYNAGIRIRGSGSRNANPPNNRINIPSDHPWNGVTAINLNVDHPEDQIAGSALFRMAALPTFEAKPVQMFSNGVNLFGERFYAHIEPLNGDFAEKHFPLDDGGNIYKGRRPNESPPGGRGAGLVYYEDPAAYVSYIKLTNESEADWSDVIHLTDVLNNAPDETYLEQVAEVIDIDQWLRYFGLHALLGNTEGGLVNGDRAGDDYAMYRGVEDSRFVMLSHDLDSLFSGVTRGIFNATNVPALRRLIMHPEIRPRYYEHLHDLIDNVLLTDDARTVVESVLRDVQTAEQIDNIFSYLQARAAYVKSITPVGIAIEHHLEDQSGMLRSDRDSTELHGQVNYRANSLTVNGQAASLSANSSWEIGSYTRTAVRTGATWNYLDGGKTPSTDWNQLGFSLTEDWGEGRAQFGYGDKDERTVLDYGDDPDAKPITYYFRHEFELADASSYLTLSMRLLRDDGAVVYVNGEEVARSNLPEGEIAADTLALSNIRNGSAERTYHSFTLDPAILQDGKNLVAVEVHQFAPGNADLSFDFSLAGRYQRPAGIPLNPGINRLVVQATSGADGAGEIVAKDFVDVWYDDGSVQEISNDLPVGETVWTAAEGPYQIRGELSVPADAVLRIEPGASVFFEPEARLTVRGTLIAAGTANQRIRFTTVPGQPLVPDLEGLPEGPARWSGIQFRGSKSSENIVAFADLEYAQDSNGSIGVINSQLVVDDVSFAGTHLRMIYGNNASLVVRNSVFPDMFAENEDPAQLGLDNVSEHIKLSGRTPEGGQSLIQNNQFGTNKGHNDVIDADSNRVANGPILQIRDNVFQGAGDELLDLGGDVYVAGNLFKHVSKDDSTSDRGYANAISTGDAGANTTLVVVRNVFYDVDHAINLKNNAATIFENNTVVQVHPDFEDRFGNPSVNAAINFFVDEPGAKPGKGAFVAGNIFSDLPRVFGNVDLPTAQITGLQLEDNLLSPEVAVVAVADRLGNTIDLGSGNQVGDPRLADPGGDDFSLELGSVAIAQIQGYDYGAVVPEGAWISGEPASPTTDRNVVLTVGGPGIFAYQYRVNGGDWSDTLSIGDGYDPNGTIRTDQIELTGLSDGDYTVELLGRDFAGNWQTVPTKSQTWTVNGQADNLMISELLAVNHETFFNFGAQPDLVELHNAGSETVNLRGMSLSDDPTDPTKFVFMEDLWIQPGEYLSLIADDAKTPGLHLGFSFRREGEGVFLYQAGDEQAGDLLDSVEFGFQIPDYSIGRVGIDRDWALTVPTFGAPNQKAFVGDPKSVVINEWLAESADQSDFVELYNSDPLPVDLSQFYFSDVVDGAPQRHQLAALSFIGANGFSVLRADGDPENGANHLDFRLSSDQESLGLVDSEQNPIDIVVYQPQTRGLSEGRLTDGGVGFTTFELPSPGWANGGGFPGDFNRDAMVDLLDVDLMCAAVRAGGDPLGPYDLNRDARVSDLDLRYLVETVIQTSFGDANLDGVFNSTDFIAVFQAGQYEDGLVGNSTWATGDWNCDGEFSSADFVTAFRRGAYTASAVPVAAVPVAAVPVDQPVNTAYRAIRRSGSSSLATDVSPLTTEASTVQPLAVNQLAPLDITWIADKPSQQRIDRFFADDSASVSEHLDEQTVASLLEGRFA